MDNNSLVILPTYNEATNIISITSRILACAANVDVLIVDDNSPDGTGQIADSISSNSPDRIQVLHRTRAASRDPLLESPGVSVFVWMRQRDEAGIAETGLQ